MSVAICGRCGEALTPQEVELNVCQCGFDQASTTRAVPREETQCGCCERLVPTTVTTCGYCYRNVCGIELEFPWGPECLRSNDTIELGRDSTTHGTRLEDLKLIAVSKTHCRLSFATEQELQQIGRTAENGALKIEDLGSLNGTFVDGRRLHQGESGFAGEGSVIRLATREHRSLSFWVRRV